MLKWTEKQLQERLDKNPALRINPKFTTPVKEDMKRPIPKMPRMVLPPMRFYEEEKPVKVILPFTYPSLNKMLRMNWYERKRQEDEFRDAVRWYLAMYRIIGFRSQVILEVTVFKPVLRYRDTDNYCYKWLKDAMKGLVIIDDDPRYVIEKPVKFEKGKPRMEIRITPLRSEKECL